MSEPTPIDLPVGLRWVKLVCRLGTLVTDSAADADAHPDLLPVGGTLTLTASPSRVRIQEDDGRWRSVDVAGRTYTIRADGELVDGEGRVGVYIPDPASLLVEPQGYAITAAVKPTGGTEWRVTVGGGTVLPDVVDLVAVSSVGSVSPSVTASLDARIYSLEQGGGVEITPAGQALTQATDAAEQRAVLDVLSMDTDRARAGRVNAARWTLAADTLTPLTKTGLTETGGYIAAAAEGAAGDAIFPNWRPNGDFRASFRVKATKTTAGSISGVGFTAGVNPGGSLTGRTLRSSLPGPTGIAWVIGYVQGSGIAVKPYNVSSGTVSVITVPDADITDGQEWDVSIWVDPYLNTRASETISAHTRATPAAGGTEYRTTLSINKSFVPSNVLIRTNVSAGALTGVEIATHPTGEIGVSTAGEGRYYAGDETERMMLRTPDKPNGKLVFGMHGHGASGGVIGRAESMMASWEALLGAGFTIAYPNLGSVTHWANDKAMTYLAELHRLLVVDYDLDPEVYMYGISMGGGATLTAIAKDVIPIRAAFLAHPSCDMRPRWVDPLTWPTLREAYDDVEADMLDNNPLNQPAAAYAGVPMLFTASPDDTTTAKADHTDAMRAHLGTVTPNYLITATGNHMDPSHFRAQDALNFFRANI